MELSYNNIYEILAYAGPVIIVLVGIALAIRYIYIKKYNKQQIRLDELLVVVHALLNNDHFAEAISKIVDEALEKYDDVLEKNGQKNYLKNIPHWVFDSIKSEISNILDEYQSDIVDKEIGEAIDKASVTIKDIEQITLLVVELIDFEKEVQEKK